MLVENMIVDNTKITLKKVCYACGTDKKTKVGWYSNYPIGVLCGSCYMRYIHHYRRHLTKTVPQQCKYCQTTETYISPDGRRHWFREYDKDGNIIAFFCKRCYKKHYEKISADKRKGWNERRMIFKDEIVFLKEPPRIGVCNLCRGVRGEINTQTGKLYKTTHIHHEEYDESDPTKHTIEACRRCHNILRDERRRYIRRLEVLLLKLNEITE